jgi:tetratricopeptide (TPR) repeat protein
LQTSQEINNEWGQVNCRTFIGWVLAAGGEVDRCLSLAEEMSSLGEKLGHPGRFLGMHLLGWLYRALGDRRQALEVAERGVREGKVFPPFYPLSLSLLAVLHLDSGELEAAGALLAEGEALGVQQTHPLIDYIVDLAGIEHKLASGLAQEALPEVDALLAQAGQSGAKFFLPDIWRLRSRILASLDQVDEAFESLKSARSAAEEIGHRMSLWNIQADLAQVLAERSDLPAAEEARRSAGAIVAGIAGNISDDGLRQTFLTHAASRGVPAEIPA